MTVQRRVPDALPEKCILLGIVDRPALENRQQPNPLPRQLL
jgi:hypothetical protein